MDEAARLLLLEDDEDLGPGLKAYLELHDFDVSLVPDGRKALRVVATEPVDVCVLDVMLPSMDGFDVASAIRAESDVPILFLTALGDRVNRLKGFRVGADDYVTKPVDLEELVARLRALVRRSPLRSSASGSDVARFGACRLDVRSGRLQVGEVVSSLTPRECDLLTLLAANQGRLVSRRDALVALWGRDDPYNRRSMDVIVYRLRRHLAKYPDVRITTVRGRGLILEILGNETIGRSH